MRTSRVVRSSSTTSGRSSGGSGKGIWAEYWAASRFSMSRTKVTRARLCGRPLRRARAIASATSRGSTRTVVPSIVISRGSAGTRWRWRTARATTWAHTVRPLISATASASVPSATTPGKRSATVAVTTPVSPRDGSTWSM